MDTVLPLSRLALRHDVVRHLLKAIFRRELAEGSPLIAGQIASRLGVSATPVREALVELEFVGMVQLVHHHGAVIKAFGPGELQGIFHIRRLMEAEATRCASGQLDRDLLETNLRESLRMLADVARLDTDEFKRAAASDRRLHHEIARHCGNPRLAHEIGRYEVLLAALREITANCRELKKNGIEGHISIIEELLAGDAAAAAAAMERHICTVADMTETILFPAG